MATELPVRIILVAPPAEVDYGLQHGRGNGYTTILTQRSKGADLEFVFALTVKGCDGDDLPNFLGPLSQGPVRERFVYIDIGKAAGQIDSCWQRRIKIPLGGITWELIRRVAASPRLILEARLPGTAKDGGPSCATVHPVEGWICCKR